MGVLVIMKVTARRACVVSVEGEDNNRHNSIHLKSATSLRRTKTKKKRAFIDITSQRKSDKARNTEKF